MGKTRKKPAPRTFKKFLKSLRKQGRGILYLDSKVVGVVGIVLLILAIWGGNMVYKNYMATIDPAVYAPLLNTIAKGESKGNYNAYWGNPTNDHIRFTDMSVGQVLKWQQEYVRQGNPSSAVGKYQIIRPTLAGLIQKLKVDPGEKFDENMQDRLAVALLEKRGANEYMKDQLSREQFAANLAKEWAALPKATGSNPDQSYYAGDGLNKVQVSTDEIYHALAMIKHKP